MGNQPVTIFGYELITPKYLEKGNYDIGRFDFEDIGYFFGEILKIPLKDRAFRKKNKMINLLSFSNANDQDFYEGVFDTARFGKDQKIINIYDYTHAGDKGKNQGLTNQVNFLIHKKTGLLLIEKDSENVARGNFIQTYIRYHKDLIHPYIEGFNKKFNPSRIYKNRFLKVISLPSKSFFEDIKEFSTIKDAYYYKDISQDTGKSNEASNLLYLATLAEENGMKNMTRVKMTFENKVPKSSIKGIEAYFKKLHEAQYFDGFGVTGRLPSGRNRTIELLNVQRAFDVSVEHHENGLPVIDDLHTEMMLIAKKDNPLSHKIKIEQFRGVFENGSKKESEKGES
ncbi:hypothetical protein [Jeotgalibacillus aurantiacus]|uniref:hypothetical protein n=1 Tax=Jeotgalibacillus aurantiacus TaxID=2763266 RepID=UPI001D0BDB2C|nr:hypothetical protein [Jeotgalibacillus aurantiacus]